MSDLKSHTYARLAKAHAHAKATAHEARRIVNAVEPVTVTQLADITLARLEAALGPQAAPPRSLSALRKLREVERLSGEGISVGEIARIVGLSYGRVVELRAERGVGRSRKRR